MGAARRGAASPAQAPQDEVVTRRSRGAGADGGTLLHTPAVPRLPRPSGLRRGREAGLRFPKRPPGGAARPCGPRALRQQVARPTLPAFAAHDTRKGLPGRGHLLPRSPGRAPPSDSNLPPWTPERGRLGLLFSPPSPGGALRTAVSPSPTPAKLIAAPPLASPWPPPSRPPSLSAGLWFLLEQLASDTWQLLVSGCRVPPGAPCLRRSGARSKNGRDAGAGALLPVSSTAVILSWGRDPLPSPERWGQASPDRKGTGRASRFLRGPVREESLGRRRPGRAPALLGNLTQVESASGSVRGWGGDGPRQSLWSCLVTKGQLLLSWVGSRCGLSF